MSHPITTKAVALSVAAVALSLVGSANAAIVHYKGDTNPTFANVSQYKLQSAGELPFHGVKFANCTINTDGSAAAFGTVNRQGVWFGYAPSIIGSVPLSWALGNSASGNDLSIRGKLGSGSSKEWGAYFYDGSHMAYFDLLADDQLLIHTSAGSQILDYPAGHFASDRDIRMILKGGTIAYYLDGVALYTGPATASSTSPLMVIGDGSGSTITGVGSWIIDDVLLDTAPSTVFIPEPTTGLLAASFGLLTLRRR